MGQKPSFRSLTRVLAAALVAATCLGLVSLARTPSLGEGASASPPAVPQVVLTASYNCIVTRYVVYGSEDFTTSLTSAISISGTGIVMAPAPGAAPGIGPGFGGIPGRYVPPPVFQGGLGLGASTGFPGGTIEDCHRFADALASVARALGCVASPPREIPASAFPSVLMSLVCEGQAADAVHAIGDLSRAVVLEQLDPNP